jgi:hypothetical protein
MKRKKERTKVRTEQLPNASVERYRHASPQP